MPSVTHLVDTAAGSAHTAGDSAWSNPTNVAAEDATFASATSLGQETQYLKATVNAGTFAIPADARIDGIEISYRADADGGTGAVFEEENCQLVAGGDITGLDLRNRAHDIGPDAADFSVGGDDENWGMTLTPDLVNEAGFGVALRFDRLGGTSRDVRVYWIKLTIHYTAAAGTPYNANADAGICLATVPTSADLTTFRFRFPGLGTPKLALFAIAFDANTVSNYDDLEATDLFKDADAYTVFSMTDGTRTYASRTWLNDADDDVERGAKALTDHELVERSAEVEFASFGEDYVELTLGSFNSSGDRVMACVAFAGDAIQARVGNQNSMDGSAGEQVDITAPGFKPALVGFLSCLEETGFLEHNVYGGHGLGFATREGRNTGAVVEQQVMDATPATLDNIKCFTRVSTKYCHENRNYGEAGSPHYQWKAGSFDANGFTITASGDDATSPDTDDGSGWFALDAGPTARLHAGVFATPGSTGAQDLSFASPLPLTPRFAMLVSTLAPAVDTDYEDSADAEAFAVTFMREGIAVTVAMSAENGTLIDSHNWTHRDGLFVPKGDETTAVQAGRPTFGAGQIQATFTTAGAYKGVYFAMGEAVPNTTLGPIPYFDGAADVRAIVFNDDPASADFGKVRDVVADVWDVFADADLDDYDVHLAELGSASRLWAGQLPVGLAGSADKVRVIAFPWSTGAVADLADAFYELVIGPEPADVTRWRDTEPAALNGTYVQTRNEDGAKVAADSDAQTLLNRTASGVSASAGGSIAADGETLTLVQGEAYLAAINNRVSIEVEDSRLTSAVTSDGTTPKLSLVGTSGSVLTVSGSISSFDSETNTATCLFELTAAQSAALEPGSLGTWEIDFEMAGSATNVLTSVIDSPLTVRRQAASS